MNTNKTHFNWETSNCYFISNGALNENKKKMSRMAVIINNDWNSEKDFVLRFEKKEWVEWFFHPLIVIAVWNCVRQDA